MIYIENEGALFRGINRSLPSEIWDGTKFVAYVGRIPKPIHWGYEITACDAVKIMRSSSTAIAGGDPKP